MRTLLIIGLILGGLAAQAQTIERQVIGSLGGISSGGTYSVDCTVGETVIDTFSSGSILLYQGYHHVNDSNKVASIKEIPLVANYVLFPNPTLDKATLRIIGASKETNLTITVFSLTGKLISTQTLGVSSTNQSEAKLDISHQSAGVYFVKITDSNSTYSQSLRLVKQ
ncbi:MAG: T9SS type A sorting domain-containing protein [Flavobacteriales bacterium]